MPSSISKRYKTDYFKNSNVNSPYTSLDEGLPRHSACPRYHNGNSYYDRPFSNQYIIMSQERLIRRTLTLIILSLLMAFATYIWFSQLDRSRLIPYQNSPDKDLPSYPIIPPARFSHEQIHLYRILGNDLPPRHKP
ncbi:14739_t:CDS:1, partial [Acaulospora morrowiae]